MSKKKRVQAPKVDKYAAESAAAKSEREQLNKRWEARQRELNRASKGATVLRGALSEAEEHTHCPLAAWECELVNSLPA